MLQAREQIREILSELLIGREMQNIPAPLCRSSSPDLSSPPLTALGRPCRAPRPAAALRPSGKARQPGREHQRPSTRSRHPPHGLHSPPARPRPQTAERGHLVASGPSAVQRLHRQKSLHEPGGHRKPVLHRSCSNRPSPEPFLPRPLRAERDPGPLTFAQIAVTQGAALHRRFSRDLLQ